MKTTPSRRRHAGYVSFLLVLATGAILTLLTVFTYRRAIAAQAVQSQVQLRVDYSEKEDAILRSIVAIAPNRAIRAMRSGSNSSLARSNPLRWRNIFTEALVMANARTSISTNLLNSLNLTSVKTGNSGDSALSTADRIFGQIAGVNDNQDTSYASSGINRSLGTGFPVPLTTVNATTIDRDRSYPIISRDKQYGSLAQTGVGLPVATYPDFNLLKYPQINFGYAKPGEDFVAKRNWWAFSMDVADHDDDKTALARSRRDFVISIYEIPSQLAISASSFMSLGQYTSGDAWQNVTIDGGIFAGKAEVTGDTAINALVSRRGMTLSSGTTIGGQKFTASPFAPGVREAYQVTQGAFFPVSLASESGRAAFIPINRGAAFFDRFDPVENAAESSTLSPTTWNNYSLGAQQCAMRMDITQVVSATDAKPTMLRFSYLQTDGTTRVTQDMALTHATQTTLPAGYKYVCAENASANLDLLDGGRPVDVAYGVSGGYTFRPGLSGPITFNNNTFGDPKVGTTKVGYWRPRSPSEVKELPSGQICVTVYPERIPALLASIPGAAGPAINNSLVLNVDYSNIGATYPQKPFIPCTNTDYGLILQECADLTPFTKGFSLVTNLRTYIGDDFNDVATTPPAGYTPSVTAANPDGEYFPPCSLFCPEKRYGVEIDPFAVTLGGQIGSLASDTVATAVRPLDSKNLSGAAIAANRLTINLSQIRHPAELPPITMMNWLVILEERRKEFH